MFNIITIPFEDKVLKINIPNNLYELTKQLFIQSKLDYNLKKIYEYSLMYDNEWILSSEDTTIKLNNNELINQLIESFENIIIEKSNSFIIHGSCLSFNNKSIVFTADRNCGKSTLLINTLNNNQNYKFISDDFVFLYPDYKISGLSFPMKLRNYNNIKGDYCYVGKIYNETRWLFKCRNEYCSEKLPLNGIISIKYTTEDINSFELISGNKYIEIMISNFKKAFGLKQILAFIRNLQINVPLYSLVYNNNEFAQKCIEEVFCGYSRNKESDDNEAIR